jgi:hypothetical protein
VKYIIVGSIKEDMEIINDKMIMEWIAKMNQLNHSPRYKAKEGSSYL